MQKTADGETLAETLRDASRKMGWVAVIGEILAEEGANLGRRGHTHPTREEIEAEIWEKRIDSIDECA